MDCLNGIVIRRVQLQVQLSYHYTINTRRAGGPIIPQNLTMLKLGVLTHKNAPKMFCKFKLVHLLTPEAIFGDFFWGGGARI